MDFIDNKRELKITGHRKQTKPAHKRFSYMNWVSCNEQLFMGLVEIQEEKTLFKMLKYEAADKTEPLNLDYC